MTKPIIVLKAAWRRYPPPLRLGGPLRCRWLTEARFEAWAKQMSGVRAGMADFIYRGLRALWKTPLGRAAGAVAVRLPAGPRRWIEQRKRRLHEAARERRLSPAEALVPERELEATYRKALRLLIDGEGPDRVGDYLEFGVYVGTSLLCMHRASKAVGLSSLRLFGFDSFQGLPETAARDDEGPWQPSQYRRNTVSSVSA